MTFHIVHAVRSRESSPDWFGERQSPIFDWESFLHIPSSPENTNTKNIDHQHQHSEKYHPTAKPQDEIDKGNDYLSKSTKLDRINKNLTPAGVRKNEANRTYYFKFRSDPEKLEFAKARDKIRYHKRKAEKQKLLAQLPEDEREAKISLDKQKRSEENKRYKIKHYAKLKAQSKDNKSIKIFKMSEAERERSRINSQRYRNRKKERERQKQG